MEKHVKRWLAILLSAVLLAGALGGFAGYALPPAGVPAGGASLVPIEVFSQSGLIETLFVPEEIVQDAPAVFQAVPSFEVVKIVDNGPDSENIVLTIMGDGYTAGEQDAFLASAVELSGELLNQHPFSSYRDVFNVYAIKVISSQSGAAETPGARVNNYFGTKFYYDGKTERLLSTSYANRVRDLLKTYTPLYDMAAILVNSTKYGGAGGSFAVTSCHPAASAILVHELGHSVGDLADEYWWRGQEAPNMTQNSNPATIKWRPWLQVEDVGIYAFDEDTRWFRPHEYCKMRYSNMPFCEVCATELTRILAGISGEAFHGRAALTNAVIGKTRIGDYAYYACENLSSVTIPAGVASIGRYAFLRCANLTKVFNYAAPPQDITGNDVFFGVDRSKVTLFVPAGTGAAYLAAGWTGFKEIKELSRPVTGVALSDSAITIDRGAQFQLAAAVAPADADNPYVNWTSGDPAVAAVSATGLVTGVSKGTAVITAATAEGGKTASCVVTVLDYVRLFSLKTKYESNFWNWFMFIALFGWIWMWF